MWQVLVCLCLVGCVLGCQVPGAEREARSGPGRLELVPLKVAEPAADLPVIPWVKAGDASWAEGEPTFELSSEDYETAAAGWVAVNEDAILLKVVVTDDVHHNDRTGGDIWDGDGLQIGVDALGDGAGAEPADTRLVGPDDVELAVALTSEGPTVWAHYHGRPGGEGELPSDYATIVRDDEKQTTTYMLTLPWKEFGQTAGFSAMIGLRVQVNDTDGPDGRHALNWGDVDNRTRPGLFNRLALADPPAGFAAAAVQRTAIYRADGYGQIGLAFVRPYALLIEAHLGDLGKSWSLTAGHEGMRRYIVRAYPGEVPETPVPFSASLVVAGGLTPAKATADLAAPIRVVDALNARVDELAASSPSPLFTRHLRSVQALVNAEWNRAMMIVDDGDQRAQEAVSFAQAILDGLNGQAGNWQGYAGGRRSLVFARISGPDQTLQYYSLSLPDHWDPARAYPLVVDLHGMGPGHPLFYVGIHFGERKEGAAAEEPPLDPHFRLAPWGRGNAGYREQGEDDVWEAIADVKKTFRVDEDRQYLTGHSMGGGGTWALGLRAPDRWAAICIVSGGTWSLPTGLGLGINAAHLPVRIWHGEADGAVSVDQAYQMQEELRKYGNEPDMVIVPGQGHSYPAEAQRASLAWLLQHRRARPDAFSYVSDTRRHSGVWGVRMARDPHLSYQPSFHCRIEGQAVHIDSEGTERLTVDLGEGGLGLSGDVRVYWNGEKVHEGPVRQLRLEPADE
jgi:predicted esterase